MSEEENTTQRYNDKVASCLTGVAIIVLLIGVIILSTDPKPDLDQTVCYTTKCNCQEFYRGGNETCTKYDVHLIHPNLENSFSYEEEVLLEFPICPSKSGPCWIDSKNKDVYFAPYEATSLQTTASTIIYISSFVIYSISLVRCVHCPKV